MQKNTDFETREKRRKQLWKSVLTTTAWHGLSAAAMLYLWFYVRESKWGVILLVIAFLELAFVAPAWLTLKSALKEIDEE